MKLHLFQGNSDSQDFQKRLGYMGIIEAHTWKDLLIKVVKHRLTYSSDWEEELKTGVDWAHKPFVVSLLKAHPNLPRTEEGLMEAILLFAKEEDLEKMARDVVFMMNKETDDFDPFLVILESPETEDLLSYLLS